MEQAGMGIAVGDFALTGSLDIVKTHFAADTQAVYKNNGKGQFRDDTLRSGLGIETRFISWGIGIEDFDNDGWPDIFWVTGGIYPELQNKPDQPYKTPRVLFRNLGKGRFEELIAEAGPGLEATHCSRGCAFGDFDNDGDIDILIVNQNQPPSLLRNDVNGRQHWLKVKLSGVKSNRSAIGARVTVRYGGNVQTREVMSQASYISANDSRLHFGLGAEAKAEVEVRWPAGQVERLGEVAADQLVHATEGSGITRLQKIWLIMFLHLLAALALFAAQQPSLEEAWKLAAAGQTDRAIQVAQHVVSINSRNADAHLLLGSLLMEKGEREASIKELSEGVRLPPNSAEAWNALGEAFQNFGDSKSARGPFEKAVALNPAFAQAHVNLGLVMLEEDDLENAALQLDRAIELLARKEDAAYAHYLRAKVYLAQSDPAKATTQLESAVTIRPDMAEAWSELARRANCRLMTSAPWPLSKKRLSSSRPTP